MASCTGRKRKTSCAVRFGLGASDLIFAAPPFGFLGMGLGISLIIDRRIHSPFGGERAGEVRTTVVLFAGGGNERKGQPEKIKAS